MTDSQTPEPLAEAELPLPTHYRDDDPSITSPNAQLCEHGGTGSMAQGCPRGCEGAQMHYANDGHAQCEDAPTAMRHSRTDFAQMSDSDLSAAITDSLNDGTGDDRDALLREQDLRAVEW